MLIDSRNSSGKIQVCAVFVVLFMPKQNRRVNPGSSIPLSRFSLCVFGALKCLPLFSSKLRAFLFGGAVDPAAERRRALAIKAIDAKLAALSSAPPLKMPSASVVGSSVNAALADGSAQAIQLAAGLAISVPASGPASASTPSTPSVADGGSSGAATAASSAPVFAATSASASLLTNAHAPGGDMP